MIIFSSLGPWGHAAVGLACFAGVLCLWAIWFRRDCQHDREMNLRWKRLRESSEEWEKWLRDEDNDE